MVMFTQNITKVPRPLFLDCLILNVKDSLNTNPYIASKLKVCDELIRLAHLLTPTV